MHPAAAQGVVLNDSILLGMSFLAFIALLMGFGLGYELGRWRK